VAKKSVLVMGQAYRQRYRMNVVYLMPMNLYGLRDNVDLQASQVIPALIRKSVEAKERVMRLEEGLGRTVAWCLEQGIGAVIH
jgi:GDP-L-fucose synthase